MSETKVIIVHETTLQSWARDAGTFTWVVSLIGLGWVLDSDAMQWFGAVVAFIVLLNRAVRASNRVDIAGARRLLDELERRSS